MIDTGLIKVSLINDQLDQAVEGIPDQPIYLNMTSIVPENETEAEETSDQTETNQVIA